MMMNNRVAALRQNGKKTSNRSSSSSSSKRSKQFVSVVIPVLNEAKTIASVVKFALCSSMVGEVIVVDDGSMDGTAEIATRAGARVMTSAMLGKGGSMEDGMHAANFDVIVYLDGDLEGLSPNLVELLTMPIHNDEADFVKAKFTRAAGRVTTLTAIPLLRTYFPEVAHFKQPLGGIIAVRKSLLMTLKFEDDYGVDVGLFLDAAAAGARLAEVDIGHLRHDSKPLEVLTDMATQVARAIIHRAGLSGRTQMSFIREVQESERHRRAELEAILSRIKSTDKLALIDMDGTVLNGRFIAQLAERTGKTAGLAQYLDRHDMDADERSAKIAALFEGVPKEVFVEVAKTIPLMEGAVQMVVALKKLGFKVGIVTDSFYVASHIVRRRVFADFSVANLMQFTNGIATGVVSPAPTTWHEVGCTEHKHCKFNVLRHLSSSLGIAPENIFAMGDGENDICMLREAGFSIAFQPKTSRVAAAGKCVVTGSMAEVAPLVEAHMATQLPQRGNIISLEENDIAQASF
ncbi:MAG: glycosyltransferase [Verrucomicrobiales bacterium]